MNRRGGRSSPLPALFLAPLLVAAGCAGSPSAPPPVATSVDPALRVEIVRTEFGVPHILADDLEGGGFGMAWALKPVRYAPEDVAAHALRRYRPGLPVEVSRR